MKCQLWVLTEWEVSHFHCFKRSFTSCLWQQKNEWFAYHGGHVAAVMTVWAEGRSKIGWMRLWLFSTVYESRSMNGLKQSMNYVCWSLSHLFPNSVEFFWGEGWPSLTDFCQELILWLWTTCNGGLRNGRNSSRSEHFIWWSIPSFDSAYVELASRPNRPCFYFLLRHRRVWRARVCKETRLSIRRLCGFRPCFIARTRSTWWRYFSGWSTATIRPHATRGKSMGRAGLELIIMGREGWIGYSGFSRWLTDISMRIRCSQTTTTCQMVSYVVCSVCVCGTRVRQTTGERRAISAGVCPPVVCMHVCQTVSCIVCVCVCARADYDR